MNGTTTITALYDRREDAQNALRDLQKMDISRNNIGLIASDTSGEQSHTNGHTANGNNLSTESDAAEGAAAGAAFGGVSGLLVGLAALAIPGIGPVLAAGPLASALVAAGIGAGVGAGIGAVTGGLVGALTEMGVSEETAGHYAEGIRRGGTLLTAHVPNSMSDQVMGVLNRHNAVDVEERASQWREGGWQAYDPNAEPYDVEEMERERTQYGNGLSTPVGVTGIAPKIHNSDRDRF